MPRFRHRGELRDILSRCCHQKNNAVCLDEVPPSRPCSANALVERPHIPSQPPRRHGWLGKEKARRRGGPGEGGCQATAFRIGILLAFVAALAILQSISLRQSLSISSIISASTGSP